MPIEISTLPNGLRVATDHMREAESAVIGAWVGVGTRHEPWGANGVAHVVEHMMFKGTRERSAYALSADIERVGGTMNAHTTREETAYYARVMPEDAELACDIVADMLLHSLFSNKELKRERQVILQEIGSDRDMPEDYVFELMHELAFPKQRIGRPILGETKVIAKLPRSAIVDYVKRHYHAGNMVIVGAGRIRHKDLVAMAAERFGKLPRGRASKADKAYVKSGNLRKTEDIEQLHLILGFPAPSFNASAVYPAQILSIILGGTSSSRLFQKVREKRGLVYTVQASHIAFADAGIFEIYAATDPARVKELVPVICNELLDVQRRITPAELRLAKAQARAEMLMGQEDVMRRANTLGHQILAFGKPIAIEHILERLMAVTRADVKEIAKRLFRARPILTALGPLKNLEDYRKIAGRLR